MAATTSSSTPSLPRPTNSLVGPLLTGKQGGRLPPFNGEFTVFAGLSEVLSFVASFHFTSEDISYLKTVVSEAAEEEGFWDYLRELDCSRVQMWAVPEGTVVFPHVPIIRVEGPLLTTLLTLINYPSLLATNAVRHRRAAGDDKTLVEFGLRRAQGPDGGISASRYAMLGLFDSTSNVQAGKLFDIPVKGTHAHAFVSSFVNFDAVTVRSLRYANSDEVCEDFLQLSRDWLNKMLEHKAFATHLHDTNDSELAAFASYAIAFPRSFLALVDTYDTLRSGTPNFCAVALALHTLGYQAVGVRLDSGDLAWLSKRVRQVFRLVEEGFGVEGFAGRQIFASSDLSEDVIVALNEQGHEIDAFGIGTHLVTCYKQPALGCVYKLVQIGEQPRIKVSQDKEKLTLPGKKKAFRLYGKDGRAVADLMQRVTEPDPKVGERVLIRHPFQASIHAYVVPSKVEELNMLVWDGRPVGNVGKESLLELQQRCRNSLNTINEEHLRLSNPVPYKISVSQQLYDLLHEMWLAIVPIGELS
eukprot:jgi/Chlat1/6911/Chrsp52S06637